MPRRGLQRREVLTRSGIEASDTVVQERPKLGSIVSASADLAAFPSKGGLALQLLLQNEVLRPDAEVDQLLLRCVQSADGSGRIRAWLELASAALTRQADWTSQRRWPMRSYSSAHATEVYVDAWQGPVGDAAVESPVHRLRVYRL